ncbi:MAG: hypothetical protein GWN00_15580, partial [Aliifodinibius sp.]|nr:hypothetical protein [Fodinibius sp.]NIV12484.1 hypothetical protein [Fodinibius sp.]NIY26172.1 hypothetical protein [Fodinibius sp.]
ANNRARHGGAVYNFFAANMMINNSTFSNNRSDDFGGAIADIKGAFLSLTQSTLVDNRDNTLGSTIYLENNAEHIATGSIIASSEDVATLCSGNM